MVVEPRGKCEQQQAGKRVRALLDEERHRIACAERGRRRGGAEHHHQAEGDEPERDEDEQALFELACGPGLHAIPCSRDAGSPLELLHQLPELLPAYFVIPELVEASARRREQHDVSFPRYRGGGGHCGGKVAGALERDAGVFERGRNRLRRLADQIGAVSGANASASGEYGSALPRPPRITSFRAPGNDASARMAAATLVAFESLT